ncbi:DNA repair protein REV1, putative [Plasmodium gallinaceum]|uniref:DNA repair protein REV1, putative n=1 Tax=Plasmodium gallinaceum TaxID=5849 RepID=A0A1J1GWF9_PLAGA|nr:DNA repair protein REV1, putative [Plasmodium gallinaceum]CRG96653.1 DNA repair protein REV1, putative [Plasmodium gallinaceum]
MNIEYGGSRSFEKYIGNKEEKIPLSYNKKYDVEIKESSENLKNGPLLFMNCNFYIDDLVSLYSLFNSNEDVSIPNTVLHNEESYMSSTNRTTSYYTMNCSIKSEFSYDNTYNDLNMIEREMNKTPKKSESYMNDELNTTNTFDTFIESYQNISTCKPSIYNSYINKKEKLEILILQNGGIIHNTLTSEVTHIISNNMALGSKKYLDYKKAIKKSKIFIVIDKYIFDCVISKVRLPEQLYLPRALRYNCHQITEYFSFKKRKKINNQNNKSSLNCSSNNNSITDTNIKEASDSVYNNENYISNNINNINNDNVNDKVTICNNLDNNSSSNLKENSITQNNNIITIRKEDKNVEICYTQDRQMAILNMQMDYKNLKKYIICNPYEYFKKLYNFYIDKELKETIFSKESNLYINEKNFDEFSRKYRLLNHLSENEIKWIKEKSKLNINIKNVWENDIIHFFFDVVLKKKKSYENKNMISVFNKHKMEKNDENKFIEKENEEIKKYKKSNSNDEENENNASNKLIDSISCYLYNSRLYILGNWNYITKEFFNFEEIKKSENRKFVYLYIDFDDYFLNASIKNNNSINYQKNANSEILCVCHSLKKEESYGVISSTNYWAKKNKIYKGMLKGEATKLHKNINFIKYDFSNILKCSYLFLLVLINYSKNVKVMSVDESIVQLFYEKEEEIFYIAKRISDDIYDLTKLNVSIGISSNLNLSKKALKFCKKRFLFFDFYHHFNIFIRKYIDMKKEKKTEENFECNSVEKTFLVNNVIDKNISSKQKIGIEHNMKPLLTTKIEKNEEANRNNDEYTNMLNNMDIENLFNEYLIFEKKRNESLEDINKENIHNKDNENNYFLNIMKEKREKNVEFIFDKFMQINKRNIEYITNTFFEKVKHPVSKHFFFYKKNDYYLNILKKFNYLNGKFINFNIYYYSPDTISDNIVEDHKNKKGLENLDEKKRINISVNYGIRFQKINDFYYLIYFMTKQLYLRLKIKNLKAKSLSVNFFMKDENENINPRKYLGRGRVIKINSKIKLSHYTDFFFIYFFKVIYNFSFLMNDLSELRGVQIICSDIVNDRHNINKKSILYYFDVKNTNCKVKEQSNSVKSKENINSLKTIEKKKEENNKIISEMHKKEKDLLKTTKEKKRKTGKKANQYNTIKRKNKKNKITANKKIGNNKEKKNTNIDSSKNEKDYFSYIKDKKSILRYFTNSLGKINIRNKLINKPIYFSSEKYKKRNFKNNFSLNKNTTTIPKKMKITNNYKIFDFFPNILKKKKINNIYSNEMKKSLNEKNLIVKTNIFDSIINKRIKIENNVKEIGCCYMCYKEIRETVKEKQNMHNDVNCKEKCADNIFCYTYVSNYLNSINQRNEKFNFYIYIKKILFSYIFYFNGIFENHNCSKKLRDQYYLQKFILNVLDNLCETLHNKRSIDVLHNFLKTFKYIWCLNKSSFPPLFQNMLIKYNIY